MTAARPFDVAAAVEGVCEDFAEGTGVALEHVTVTWEFFEPGHYAVAGKAARQQPRASHPVLVDLLAPDFNRPDAVEAMVKAVARSVARRAGLPGTNVFVSHREARSGAVFDAGEVVRW